MSSSHDTSSIENFISANKNSGVGNSAITTAITRSNKRTLKGGALMTWLFYTSIVSVVLVIIFVLYRFFRR